MKILVNIYEDSQKLYWAEIKINTASYYVTGLPLEDAKKASKAKIESILISNDFFCEFNIVSYT